MNNDTFENLLKQLQKKIEYEEQNIFSKTVIEEYKNPTNFGKLNNPNRTGSLKGPCGDTMRIDLLLNDQIISVARFWTDGCGPSIACGNMLTKMIIGKTVDNAMHITSSKLLYALDGLPEDHQHCATLAINTLHKLLKESDKR